MVGGVGPTVGVMEIDHQLHACILDALAQFLDIVEILHDTRLAVPALLGIDKEAHADSIPSARFLDIGNDIADGLAIPIVVWSIILLVAGQQRDVATHKVLGGFGPGNHVCQRTKGE